MENRVIAVDENGNIVGETDVYNENNYDESIQYSKSEYEFNGNIFGILTTLLFIVLLAVISSHLKKIKRANEDEIYNNLDSILSELNILDINDIDVYIYSGTRNLLTIKYKTDEGINTHTYEISDMDKAIKDMRENNIKYEFVGKEDL